MPCSYTVYVDRSLGEGMEYHYCLVTRHLYYCKQLQADDDKQTELFAVGVGYLRVKMACGYAKLSRVRAPGVILLNRKPIDLKNLRLSNLDRLRQADGFQWRFSHVESHTPPRTGQLLVFYLASSGMHRRMVIITPTRFNDCSARKGYTTLV